MRKHSESQGLLRCMVESIDRGINHFTFNNTDRLLKNCSVISKPLVRLFNFT